MLTGPAWPFQFCHSLVKPNETWKHNLMSINEIQSTSWFYVCVRMRVMFVSVLRNLHHFLVVLSIDGWRSDVEVFLSDTRVVMMEVKTDESLLLWCQVCSYLKVSEEPDEACRTPWLTCSSLKSNYLIFVTELYQMQQYENGEKTVIRGHL